MDVLQRRSERIMCKRSAFCPYGTVLTLLTCFIRGLSKEEPLTRRKPLLIPPFLAIVEDERKI